MSREPKARDIPERRWGNAKLIRTDGWQCLHHKMDVRSTGDSEFFKRWSHRRRQYDQSDSELLRKYDCIRTGKTVCSEQRHCRQDKSVKTAIKGWGSEKLSRFLIAQFFRMKYNKRK